LLKGGGTFTSQTTGEDLNFLTSSLECGEGKGGAGEGGKRGLISSKNLLAEKKASRRRTPKLADFRGGGRRDMVFGTGGLEREPRGKQKGRREMAGKEEGRRRFPVSPKTPSKTPQRCQPPQ